MVGGKIPEQESPEGPLGMELRYQQRRPITVRENRQWKPAVAYCRYADGFVVIVKGTKAHAQAIREECRAFLEGELKLTLNMGKTHVTHVNDGFIFLGHRIIRKRGPRGTMRPVTTIPKEKLRHFAATTRLTWSKTSTAVWRAGRTSTNTRIILRPCMASSTELFSGSLPAG